MTDSPLMRQDNTEPAVRSYKNAPPLVRAHGGVVMSMWRTGAGMADIEIVAEIVASRERLRVALCAVRDELSNGQTANWDFIEGHFRVLDA